MSSFSPEEIDLGQTIRGFSSGQKLFGRHTLKAVLGRGGMGIVWRAWDEQLERDVALKFLPELVIHDRAVLDDLKKETRRSLELTHPHIVRIHDFVQDSQTACISMEYVDGDTLSSLRCEQPNRVFEPEALEQYVRELCDALGYAHQRARIVHRDLKPANLMVNARGELKVADFGIARTLTDSVSMLTMARGTSGTLVYMSPQQLTGERASHLDDIYSVGATLYELLTGKPPFYSGNVDKQIHEKKPPRIAERRDEFEIPGAAIPERWEQTIAACLAKDPAQRPQSAADLAQRLALTSGGPTVPTQPPPAADRRNVTTPHPLQKRLLAGAAVALLLLGAAAAYYFGIHVPAQARQRLQIAEKIEQTEKAERERRATEEKQRAEAAEQERLRAQAAEEEKRLAVARAEEERAKNAPGWVVIKTEPAGATVTLGSQTRTTPVTFTDIAAGKSSARITLAGYEPQTLQVDVKPNGVTDAGIVTLKPLAGSSVQTVSPSPTDRGATVSASDSSIAKSSPSPAPTAETKRSFAGTWKGKVSMKCADGFTSQEQFEIRVSSDEQTITTDWAPFSGGFQSKGKRKGDTLTWSFRQKPNSSGDSNWNSSCSLTLRGASSATFVRNSRDTGGRFEDGCRSTGTLSR